MLFYLTKNLFFNVQVHLMPIVGFKIMSKCKKKKCRRALFLHTVIFKINLYVTKIGILISNYSFTYSAEIILFYKEKVMNIYSIIFLISLTLCIYMNTYFGFLK